MLALPHPVAAAPASLTISSDTFLRFGAFVVLSRGARVVSPSGTVTDESLFPVNTIAVGPGQFTVTFDRGNNDPKPYAVIFQLVLGTVSPVNQSGITGTLSAFSSDLPGGVIITPGQAFNARMLNCTTRICTKIFHVGARLDIARSSGGGELAIALPIVAQLIDVEKL